MYCNYTLSGCNIFSESLYTCDTCDGEYTSYDTTYGLVCSPITSTNTISV